MFFFAEPANTEIYTLSLHDALPIFPRRVTQAGTGRTLCGELFAPLLHAEVFATGPDGRPLRGRSEEHTSELQSRRDVVCRRLLEKKNEKGHRRARDVELMTGGAGGC